MSDPVEVTEKVCPDCRQSKPVDDFGLNRSRPDGRAFYCKVCFRKRSNAGYRGRRASAGYTVRERIEVPDGYKYCPRCESAKPVERFHRAPKQSGGRASWCAECKLARDKDTRFWRVYGITKERRDALIAEQGGVCAICRTAPAVHVDHDHVFGTVRGVVCFSCNVGIGHFRDDVQLMRRAIDYLETTTWQRTPVCTGVYQLTSPRRGARPSSSSSELQHPISSPPDATSRPE